MSAVTCLCFIVMSPHFGNMHLTKIRYDNDHVKQSSLGGGWLGVLPSLD